ncbi:putative nucleotide-sugar transporter [Aspergillus ruber CBS 135680]|uniref:Putative nucleotide-sugar transporter n=1 Tax=Aspergillus ruber (strain CBS 135680) TaxID=1388766 RepID=A0A017SDU4_ASPRC|nr:putative nucleotide-sugar transporter [Aspergillus ruber CBS 135680]EYE95102.1 putative nucleotide-sugar transporter [Aspergillus ruber CBS 135680]
MGLSHSGSHHRRRSSMLTGAAGPSHSLPTEQREESPRIVSDGAGHKREEQKPLNGEDAEASDLSSIAESMEMDYMSTDDDLHDDEETGLTAKQRRQQRRRRRRQRRQLDARIADVKASRKDVFSLGLAERSVLQRLLVNGVLILSWYFFSLSISIYNKWMFSQDDIVFPFPLFTTSLHMAVQFTLSGLILWAIPSLRPNNPSVSAASGSSPIQDPGSSEKRPLITRFFYLTRLVPCGTATSLDIGLGNMSLKYISLTFLTMCKSSALAFVLLFAFIFRLETLSVKLIIIIAAMTVGVVMMVAGETAFNAVGFALVIASAFFSGFRWGLTQILLLRHPATSNPFSTLFFLTPVMFISLIVISLAVERPAEIANGFQALAAAHGTGFGLVLLIFPGVLAFCMISSEFALLKRSSVVTLSICGIFKEVITISAAGVVFHDQLTAVNLTGLIVTIGSIATYNYMKISKMRQDALSSMGDRSPTTGSDTDSDAESPAPSGSRGYQQVPNLETGMAQSSPRVNVADNVNITPADDMAIGGPRSYGVRTSGASSATHGLSITTNLEPPRSNSASPLKSAPPIITFTDTDFPSISERGPAHGSQSASQSPERNTLGHDH